MRSRLVSGKKLSLSQFKGVWSFILTSNYCLFVSVVWCLCWLSIRYSIFQGSGKTLAFGIPLLTHILNKKSNEDNELVKDAPTAEEKNESLISEKAKKPFLALIMTPTRELALQVTNHLKQAAKHTSVEVLLSLWSGVSCLKGRWSHSCNSPVSCRGT